MSRHWDILYGIHKDVRENDIRIQNNNFENDYMESCQKTWQSVRKSMPTAKIDNILTVTIGRLLSTHILPALSEHDKTEAFHEMNQTL